MQLHLKLEAMKHLQKWLIFVFIIANKISGISYRWDRLIYYVLVIDRTEVDIVQNILDWFIMIVGAKYDARCIMQARYINKSTYMLKTVGPFTHHRFLCALHSLKFTILINILNEETISEKVKYNE